MLAGGAPSGKGDSVESCRTKRAIEALAEAVILAEESDRESIASLRRLLENVEKSAKSQQLTDAVEEGIFDLLSVGPPVLAKPDAEGLKRFAEAIEAVQKLIHRCHKEGASTCSEAKVKQGPEKTGEPQPARPNQSSPAIQERDADTIVLIGEFLSESDEGLIRADQTLMSVEHKGDSAEAINNLFRVFHTIKGVAGFLEMLDIQSLAHTTESLLNGCREGQYQLSGERLDLVFDATAMMRRILVDLRRAVENSREFITQENIAGLVARLKVALEVTAPTPGPVPTPAPDLAPAPEPSPEPAPALAATEGPQSPMENMEGPPAKTDMPIPSEVQQASPVVSSAPMGAPNVERTGDSKIRATIKVDLERVDRLVEMIGELVVVEAMVVGAPEIAHSGSARVRNCLSQLAKVTRDLQDVGMRMRMLPVASVFQKMARMARDVGRRAGKQVRVVLSGEQTEMDRSMVEQISDPLVHMIRNSIDHGIEPPEGRKKAGKPEEGTIHLNACHEGGTVVIEISDDGRGLNREAILKKAIAQGMVQEAEVLSDEEVHSMIFAPGFSTAEKVTDISGRGVGMDVVRKNIDAMSGRVAIKTTPGQGTTFKISLPLTLAIIDGMLVSCGQERYILPTLSVVESIKPDASMLVTQGGTNEMLNMRGMILPLLRMDRLLGAKNGIQDPTQALVVIIEGAGRQVGLLVDEVVAQQQVVIKTMGEGIGQVRYISGAAILSDGRVGLIVNVEEIAALVVDKRHRGYSGDSSYAPANF
jgi:two-component system chemotaxis sensor kinase CheA